MSLLKAIYEPINGLELGKVHISWEDAPTSDYSIGFHNGLSTTWYVVGPMSETSRTFDFPDDQVFTLGEDQDVRITQVRLIDDQDTVIETRYITIGVYTPADLNAIRNNLSSDYILMNDVDLTPWGEWTPIGMFDSRFTGSFDGNGKSITDLTITEYDINAVGLFGFTNAPVIKNLSLIDVSINVQTSIVGSVVGRIDEEGLVENCFSTGEISGGNNVGGLVGLNAAGSVINCYSKVHCSGSTNVGGLVARNISLVENCYSTGTVSSDVGAHGGLIGDGTDGTVISSYWDTETSELTISDGGVGKTTEEMQNKATYVNWDFSNIWGLITEIKYPVLRSNSGDTYIVVTTYINDNGLPIKVVNAYTKTLEQSKLGESNPNMDSPLIFNDKMSMGYDPKNKGLSIKLL